jgi:hypothetical protein
VGEPRTPRERVLPARRGLRAKAARARRAFLLGLRGAQDLLGAELPEGIDSRIRRERWVETLAGDVRARIMEQSDYQGSFSEVLSRNLFQLPLQQTFRERRRYLAYRLTTPNRPDSWRTVRVGDRWLALHAFIWPLRLVTTRATAPFRYGMRRR